MNKKFLTRSLAAMALVAAAVLYLLNVIDPEKFGFFNLAWAGMIVSGAWGLILLLDGVFERNVSVVKKFKILGGSILLICAVICAVFACLLPQNLVVPIIVLVVAVAIFLGIVATGAKKWDEGDNQKIGYENYHQRKAREEKENQEK